MSVYSEMSEEDKQATMEGRLLSIMTEKFGGQRFVAGPKMSKLIKDIVSECKKMRDDGLL